MPKSKKPRKKHTHKVRMSPYSAITPEVTAQINEFFTRFCLIAEMKLPTGKCDAVDLAYISEIFNLCTMGLASRPWINPDDHADIMPIYNKAINAVTNVAQRGHATGHYVCTGEELTLIRDMLIPAEHFLRDSLATCPRRVIKEWHALQDIKTNKDVLSPRQVTVAEFRRAVKKYGG